MSRVNHRIVKERLNEKRSKISDSQFFSSRILAGYYEDIAAAQSRRYQYNRRVRVDLYWDPYDGEVAFTDNAVIHLNMDTYLESTSSVQFVMKRRKLKKLKLLKLT